MEAFRYAEYNPLPWAVTPQDRAVGTCIELNFLNMGVLVAQSLFSLSVSADRLHDNC